MKLKPELSQLGLLLGPLVLVGLCAVGAFWLGNVITGGTPLSSAPPPPLRATATPPPTSVPTATPTPAPSATPFVYPGPIRDMGRLITADQEFTVWQTIEERPDWWPFPFWTNKIVLIAVGRVEAGVDLEKISDSDVLVSGTSVVITLPPPEFFGDPNLDLSQTVALEGSSFNPISMDWNQMIEAQLAAEVAIQNKAFETQLLERARKNAATQLELLLRRAGASEVTVNWRDHEQ